VLNSTNLDGIAVTMATATMEGADPIIATVALLVVVARMAIRTACERRRSSLIGPYTGTRSRS
jgi:hypothetical protein